LEESDRELLEALSLIFLKTLRRKPKSVSRKKDSNQTLPDFKFQALPQSPVCS